MILFDKFGRRDEAELSLSYDFSNEGSQAPVNDAIITAEGNWIQLFEPIPFGPTADITFNPFFVQNSYSGVVFYTVSKGDNDPEKVKCNDAVLLGEIGSFQYNTAFLGWA